MGQEWDMLGVFILQCLVGIVIALHADNTDNQKIGRNNQKEFKAVGTAEIDLSRALNRIRRGRKYGKKVKKRNKGKQKQGKVERKKKEHKKISNKRKNKKKINRKQKKKKSKRNKNKNKESFKGKQKKKNLPNSKKLKSAKGNRQVLTGDNCNWMDFDTARSRGANCEDGTKMVIKNRKGVRKQFLLTGGKTIYGFVTKGEKFADCSNLAEITDLVTCKSLSGLSAVSLSGSITRLGHQAGRVFIGKMCEWIDISKVRTSGQGCGDGSKFVITQEKGTRKQFLFVDGKDIIAFVKNKEKFANCSSYTEVTSQVDCKSVPGIETVNLSGNESPTTAPTIVPFSDTGECCVLAVNIVGK